MMTLTTLGSTRPFHILDHVLYLIALPLWFLFSLRTSIYPISMLSRHVMYN